MSLKIILQNKLRNIEARCMETALPLKSDVAGYEGLSAASWSSYLPGPPFLIYKITSAIF